MPDQIDLNEEEEEALERAWEVLSKGVGLQEDGRIKEKSTKVKLSRLRPDPGLEG